MAKHKFKLLVGSHFAGGAVENNHFAGGQLFSAGDIIECDIDLVARFGPDKFQRMDGTQAFASVGDFTDAQLMAEIERRKIRPEQRPPAPMPHDAIEDVLDTMSVKELEAYALEEEIDLGAAVKKADILRAIRGAEQLA